MKLIISNSSRYPEHMVKWLVKFALKQVLPVAEREGWLERIESKPISIRVTNSRHAYCGRYLSCPQAASISRPFKRPADIRPDEYVRDILVRTGPESRFPSRDVYARYQDMPEGVFNDWCEAMLGVTAHELAHTKYSGKRDGEFNCELVSQDAVIAFRKVRGEFDTFCTSHQADIQDREIRMAAKQSPEAVKAQKIIQAEAAVVRWTRKAKLAQTKLKKYQRTLRRLSK